MSSSNLDLKHLVGNNQLSENTDKIIDNLLNQIENLNVEVNGTGDLFHCAINLSDLTNFDLDLDFFKRRTSGLSYTLLYKIQQLKRYISNINNIFIELIGNLECCNSDDRYNRLVLPIFKWLVEDENGLCGTLLKISEQLYTIYLPLKRIKCLFKPLPGNPTLSFGGMDFFKAIYPIIEGIEKTMNMIDNGRFLDILIIPVKNFHDKLLACSNGKDAELYSKYDSISDIISTSMYDELTVSLINELKAKKAETEVDSSDSTKPVAPQIPIYNDFYNDNPRPKPLDDQDAYFKELYNWNIKFSDYKRDIDREYNKQYSNYLDALRKYNDDRFKKTLELSKSEYSSSNLTVDLSVEDFKKKFKPICGCLAEIFNADGFFFPKNKIIRSKADLKTLIGEVEYKGISADNYYFDSELSGKRRVKIINEMDLNEIKQKEVVNDLSTSVSYALNLSTLKIGEIPDTTQLQGLPQDLIIKLTPTYNLDDYLQKINGVKTINDVILLDEELNKLLVEKKKQYSTVYAFLDTVQNSFKNLYNNEILTIQTNISRIKATLAVNNLNQNERSNLNNELVELNRLLTNYAFMPPKNWDKSKKILTGGYASGVGTISYEQYELLVDNVRYIDWEITLLNQAIMRNHAVIKLVDENGLECGCDLLCMVVKYIISLILDIIKKIINYIVSYLTKSILNKELQWWLEFISQKINCILDILNLGNEISEMRKRFETEIESAKGMLQEASNNIGNCSQTDSKIMTDMILYDERSKLDVGSLVDITWQETNYPEFEYDSLDVSQNTDTENPFTLELENVTYEDTDWKNRSIPTIITDCNFNHKVKANWVPTTNSWSSFINVTINMDQFNSSNFVTINGNEITTEEELINNTYDTLIWNLINRATGMTDFNFIIEISNSKINCNSETNRLENTNLIFDSGTIVDINTIDRVWFFLDSEEIKVFDRLQSTTLSDLLTNTKSYMQNLNTSLANENIDYEEELPSSSKVCSATSLTITKFEPLYNDSSLLMYPGTLTKGTQDGEIAFVLTPKQDPNTLEYFARVNVPYIIEFENLTGRKFTLILLIDICSPNEVMKTNYNRSRDGVFLNDRYDLIEFDAIPNNISKIYYQKDIIKTLSKFLEEEGLISSFLPGLMGSLNQNTTEDVEYIDNTETEEVYDSSIDFSDAEKVSVTGYKNLPAGVIKNSVYASQAKLNELNDLISDLNNYTDELSLNLTDAINNNIENTQEFVNNLLPSEIIDRGNSKLGIPILVLNEEENIILTIHDKKLKLLNINRNFGILKPDLIIEQEIDYREGENLFIGFSTTGFTHTIYWLNERKVKYEASVTTTTVINLKPTFIGSVYKDDYNTPIALLCGKINDIIFTNSNRTPEEWHNNSNTFRPEGTIGFYDFSLFDGYHVYSIPQYFKITTFGELATVKGILYESASYTKEEIGILLQEGKINELEQTKLTIVGERPISVNGDFIWKNNIYYKNVTFGYLDNFFCRDNLKDSSFTISFWLKQKDSITNSRVETSKKYIISDTNNGNFIWIEEDILYIKLYNQPLRSEPIKFIFKEDIYASEPTYVEKWFYHVFRYDRVNGKVYYNIKAIDQNRNFDSNYSPDILDDKKIVINLNNVTGKGRVMDFSLVSMLARYDMKTLMYMEQFHCEITALAIWKEYKQDDFILNNYSYQKRIIMDEM